MKAKKWLALLLAGSMLTGCLTGCGNSSDGGDSSAEKTDGGESKAEESKESTGTEEGSAGNSGETVKLTALISKHSLTRDVNEMEWLRIMEEESGVEIEWQQISADWDQKKSVMFAGGDIPDMLFKATGTDDFVQYNGLFADFAPYIDGGQMPNVAKMFEDQPQVRKLCMNEAGEIYGLPNYRSLWPRTNRGFYINKVWLDNLNLPVPTTMDELEEVMIAFKEGDPNGNGDNTDEIPMDFEGFPAFIFACFGAPLMNESGGYFVEDGQVKNYRVDERYKVFVQWLQKLFSQGLINEEVLTQDYSKYQSIARGDGTTAKVGVTVGWETGDRFGMELADQYIALPALKPHADSDENEVYWLYNFDGDAVSSSTVSMSAACKDKEAAVRFIDSFYEEKNSVQVLFGGMNDIDKCTKDNGDGTYEVLPPSEDGFDPGTWKWMNAFADWSPFYFPDDMKDRLKMGTDMQKVLEERKALDPTLDRMEQTCESYPATYITYSADDRNTMAMNQANINNIVDQTYALWLTDSTRDIEAEWDDYVKSVYDAGLTQNLEIRQAAYEKFVGAE